MNIKERFDKWIRWIRRTPERKRWFDVLTAILTIPVLLTVIITNIINLQSRNKTETSPLPSTTAAPIQITIENPTGEGRVSPVAKIATPSPSGPACKEGVPEYEIVSPREGEELSNDPVCVVHAAQTAGYCATTWSYRINDASWSPYTDTPVCLYNMASGPIKFELRIKGANGEEKTYTRKFVYNKLNSALPSPQPQVTP